MIVKANFSAPLEPLRAFAERFHCQSDSSHQCICNTSSLQRTHLCPKWQLHHSNGAIIRTEEFPGWTLNNLRVILLLAADVATTLFQP